MSNPAHQYALDCVSGKKPVCKWVRLACKRYLDLRKNGHKKGITYNQDLVDRVLNFFETLIFPSGTKAEKIFAPSEWQQFIIANLFGFLNKKGLRLFNTAYIEIPKKNGKSTFVAAIGLYMLIADGELSANVYCVAVSKEQIFDEVFKPAKLMAKKSDYVMGYATISQNAIAVIDTNSTFKCLSAKDDTLEGKNGHCVIIDELHRHPDGGILRTMKKGQIARLQPLTIIITNSGFDIETVCGEENELAQKILEGTVEDDSRFAMIFTIDEGDDWEDPNSWKKANPEFGRGVVADRFEQEYRDAKNKPSELNGFKRFNLSVWTEALTAWIPKEKWNLCNLSPMQPDDTSWHGHNIIAGGDLSSTQDTTSLVIVWEVGDILRCKAWIWIPEGILKDRKYREQILRWVDDGWIIRTGGDTVDYDLFRDQVLEIAEKAELQELNMDPYRATQLTNQLIDLGINVINHRQGFLSMSDPMEQTEKIVIDKQLDHGGNPVLAWMMSNVMIVEDPAGNKKAHKQKSRDKIDGIVCLVMAVGRAKSAGFEEEYTPDISFL